MFALALTRRGRTPCAKYLRHLDDYDANAEFTPLRQRIMQSSRMKFTTYRTMVGYMAQDSNFTLVNPVMDYHPMYQGTMVAEYKRLAATRVRLIELMN